MRYTYIYIDLYAYMYKLMCVCVCVFFQTMGGLAETDAGKIQGLDYALAQ